VKITTEQALWIYLGLLTLGYVATIFICRRLLRQEQQQTRVWRNKALTDAQRADEWRRLYLRQGKALHEARAATPHFTLHEDGTVTQHVRLVPDEQVLSPGMMAVLREHLARQGR